jgi:hypothetical protein
MKTVQSAEQTTIIDGNTNGAAKKTGVLEPLKFVAKRDVAVTEIALQLRGEDLKNLAKKNQQEGYSFEANVMLQDAAAIEHRILPQLRSQRELPLVSFEALEKQVADSISGLTRRVVAGLDEKNANLKRDALKHRSDSLTRDLAARIASCLRDTAQAAYSAGFAARSITPEGIAAEQMRSLRGGRDD